MTKNTFHGVVRQRGVALFVTLLVLLIISLLGMSALRISLAQNKITLNGRIDAMTFQGAESGIRAVISEAQSSTMANTNNVIGAAIAAGTCTDDSETSTCAVFRCVTPTGSLSGRCSAQSGSPSVDSVGVLQVETRTRSTGSKVAVNNSAGMFQDYVFETNSKGCLLDGSSCSTTNWNENLQEFKKLAPRDNSANLD